MDIEGNKIDFSEAPKGMKTPKMANMTRISGRKSWIIQAKTSPSNFGRRKHFGVMDILIVA